MTDAELHAERLKAIKAAENAKAVLKIGDICQAHMCGGRKRRFIFSGWDQNWAKGRTAYLDGTHPISIYKVNGVPVDFTA